MTIHSFTDFVKILNIYNSNFLEGITYKNDQNQINELSKIFNFFYCHSWWFYLEVLEETNNKIENETDMLNSYTYLSKNYNINGIIPATVIEYTNYLLETKDIDFLDKKIFELSYYFLVSYSDKYTSDLSMLWKEQLDYFRNRIQNICDKIWEIESFQDVDGSLEYVEESNLNNSLIYVVEWLLLNCMLNKSWIYSQSEVYMRESLHDQLHKTEYIYNFYYKPILDPSFYANEDVNKMPLIQYLILSDSKAFILAVCKLLWDSKENYFYSYKEIVHSLNNILLDCLNNEIEI